MADDARLAKSEAARERLGRALALAEARLSKLTNVCACGAESERAGPWRCTRDGCEVGDLLDHEAAALIEEYTGDLRKRVKKAEANAVTDAYTASLRERVAQAEANAAAWQRGVEAANRISQRERERAERAEAALEAMRSGQASGG